VIGETFWRAQLGDHDIVGVLGDNGEVDHDLIRPHKPDRMTPSSKHVGNGRANPVGIAYWYAATDPKTAMEEMRPWKGAVLTVAELHATRNLELIDCGNTQPTVAPYSTAPEPEKEKFVWYSIGEAFSRPVAPTAINVDYVPTQMLAEAFRMAGFDGIRYKSHLGDGMNVVVFQLSDFVIRKREVWKAKTVRYEFESHDDGIHLY